MSKITRKITGFFIPFSKNRGVAFILIVIIKIYEFMFLATHQV